MMALRKTSVLIGLALCFTLIVGAGPSKTETTKSTVRTATKTPTVFAPRAANHLPETILETAPQAPNAAAAYEIPWSSINGGGAPSSSTNYSVNASVGQSAIGFATSTNYQAGIGYWYGAEAAGGGCDCPFQGDMNADNVPDAVDLNALIDALFFGGINPQDPNCPTTRGDVTADGVPDAVDLNYLIDLLFFGGPPAVDPCI